jgi:hypothetical protein
LRRTCRSGWQRGWRREGDVSRPTRITVLATVSVVVAVIGLGLLSSIGAEEQPPCSACIQPGSELPRVSVCDLANDVSKLAGKVVRVTSDFRNDAGQLFLQNGDCQVHAGFAAEWRACRGAWRKLQMMCGVDSWYDGSAPVSVTGSLSTIPQGNYYAGEEGFTISCLEMVQSEPGLGKRIRFVMGRLF